ncbi:hypothetical protein GCM10029964_065670 [Kibdelosporangium lantanae]
MVGVDPGGHDDVAEHEPVPQRAGDPDEQHGTGPELGDRPLGERGGGRVALADDGDGNVPARDHAPLEQGAGGVPVARHVDQVFSDREVLRLQGGEDHYHLSTPPSG